MNKHNSYHLICGMEIHAELKTQSKMFCGCKNDPFGAPKPNCYTCPVCLGLPGALPVPNAKAIEWTIKLGLALGCKINLFSKFDRKHYFYPDLPKGYQISQYDLPFCYDGQLETSQGTVRIRRIHLEEDTGKLLHKTINNKKVSLIDFNRSSVPLVEIVTEPDIKSASQASEYAKKIRSVLRTLNIADCNMEQGGMRLEANISLQKEGEKELPNYKVELKNINSFRFLEQGIDYEVKRQGGALSHGEVLSQETRGYNSTKQETFVQRSKEDAEDYRYFPDPDIPPIHFSQSQIDIWRQELPELPWETIARLKAEYGIEEKFADLLLSKMRSAKLISELLQQAKQQKIDCNSLVKAVINKKISTPNKQNEVEQTLQEFLTLTQTNSTDDKTIIEAIDKVLQENPDLKSRYQSGEKQLLGFIMGQVMRIVGKTNPQQLKTTIEKHLIP